MREVLRAPRLLADDNAITEKGRLTRFSIKPQSGGVTRWAQAKHCVYLTRLLAFLSKANFSINRVGLRLGSLASYSQYSEPP